MSLIIIAIIFCSHILAARPFIGNLQKGKMPNTAHFAVISVILYYDFGLLMETLGLFGGNPFFITFFDAKPLIVLSACIILVSAPWLFLLGSKFTSKERSQDLGSNFSHLIESRKNIFYLLIAATSICVSIIGINEVLQSESLWGLRSELAAKWGPLILILYLPLHFLSFYTRQSDSASKNGLLFSWGLVFATILSTVGIAQRTTLLLPILILTLFRKKISLQRIAIFLAVAIVVASALLPFFKYQKQESQDVSNLIGSLITETIEVDFYRGGVLVTALDKSDLLGTKIMPYPMSGYIYSLMFYLPREILSFKGWSTSQHFTSIIDKTPVEETKWGLGVGVVEELLLNIGLLLTIPCLFIYGMAMGLIDRLSLRVPSLLIPSRLGAIWICGYESSVLLFTFGTMTLVAISLHLLFTQKTTTKGTQIVLYKRTQVNPKDEN
jgi:hypothetical protein